MCRYACRLCSYTTNHRPSMEDHVFVHTNEKPYKWVLLWSFSRRWTRVLHSDKLLKINTNIRLYFTGSWRESNALIVQKEISYVHTQKRRMAPGCEIHWLPEEFSLILWRHRKNRRACSRERCEHTVTEQREWSSWSNSRCGYCGEEIFTRYAATYHIKYKHTGMPRNFIQNKADITQYYINRAKTDENNSHSKATDTRRVRVPAGHGKSANQQHNHQSEGLVEHPVRPAPTPPTPIPTAETPLSQSPSSSSAKIEAPATPHSRLSLSLGLVLLSSHPICMAFSSCTAAATRCSSCCVAHRCRGDGKISASDTN